MARPALSLLTGALLAAACLCLSPVQAEAGMRCGTRLVSGGDSTYRVRQLCGDPAESRARVEQRSVAVRSHQLPNGSWVYAQRTQEIQIDEWLYDLGPHKFMRRLTFEGGLLVDMKTEGYGYPR